MMGPVYLRLAGACLLTAFPAVADAVQVRIVTDDGMPLPESTFLQLGCDDAEPARTTAGNDGSFEFESASARPDCLLEVDAPGYRGGSVRVEDLPGDHRIPAMVLHRLGKNQGEAISVSNLAAPEAAVREFHSAIRAMGTHNPEGLDSAIQHLRAAIQTYPNYAGAWFEMGRILLARGDPPDAIDAFRRAVQADPWYVSPYEPLILLLEAAGDREGAARACRGLRRINPKLPGDCHRKMGSGL